ncbi:hypothetical protein [Paraburkholderia sp. DHOC27]|uniref:hypothetical protein n=1 Tax=Paraburkholderia sp. DHOC27 TaxID=2303330 RepID=UPI000E3CAE6D|nr:hypothetical protein [Paraburkholderia sp. DHOC27]RFU47952.1 hypothetical protein D0B32_10510 [Paraburkholderia sp. DHOC27]
MATIAIKDLPDSIELDREAMTAVVGGARHGVRYGSLLFAATQPAHLFDYPLGFTSTRPFASAANTGSALKRK